MPIAGIGLHVVFAALCAIHAIRTRQQMYWLFILFMFPLLGSLVYLFAVYLPNSRLERGAMKAVASAVKVIDPSRAVREARVALADAPTTQNQMRLASALLEAGDAESAAQLYDTCLKGPLGSDLEIRFGAARAFVACRRFAEAHDQLASLRREKPDFRPEATSLLIARALAGAGRNEEAGEEFRSAISRFGTYEAKAEYAVWAYTTGDHSTAEQVTLELNKLASRWNAHTRELNAPVMRKLSAAKALATKQG